MRLLCSASGMKPSGDRSPRCGCCQRTSASTPCGLSAGQSELGLVVQDELARGRCPAAARRPGRGGRSSRPRGRRRRLARRARLFARCRARSACLSRTCASAAVLRVRGQAEARADVEREGVDLERRLELAQHPMGDRDRVGDVRVGQQQRELVAAEPRHDGLGRRRRPQAHAHLAQERVAELVAERVVDRLEVVEVGDHHDQPAAASLAHMIASCHLRVNNWRFGRSVRSSCSARCWLATASRPPK